MTAPARISASTARRTSDRLIASSARRDRLCERCPRDRLRAAADDVHLEFVGKHELQALKFGDCLAEVVEVDVGSSFDIRNFAFTLLRHEHPANSFFQTFPASRPDRICLKFYAKLAHHSRFRSPHSRIFPAYPLYSPVFQFLFDCPSMLH